jgi:sugar phosphate isomerase/epimerase
VRVAVHTYCFRDRDGRAALEAARALGVAAVELWLPHAREPLGDAMRRLGLEAVAVGGLGIHREADVSTVAAAAAVARDVGTALLVGTVAPELLEQAASRLPPGFTLAVENHWDQPFASAQEVARALDRVPRARACLDTGHALLAGDAPEAAIRALGARVAHVHLKDAATPARAVRLLGRRLRRRYLRPQPVAPGAGDLDVDGVVAALHAAQYRGAVTVEYEGGEPDAALRHLIHSLEEAEGRSLPDGARSQRDD